MTAKGGEAYFALAIEWTDGSPLVIDGLWGLTIGNGSALGGSLDTLFFTAGPNGESDGLFGSLAVPEPSTWAVLLLGFTGLGIAGYRTSRKPQRPHKRRSESRPLTLARLTSPCGAPAFLVPTVESVGHAISRGRWITFTRFTVGEIAGPFGSLRH